MTGWTAIVVPVRRGGERLALKVTWPHPEGTHEPSCCGTGPARQRSGWSPLTLPEG